MTALGPSCTLARGQGGAQGIRFTSPAYSSLYCGDLLLSVSGGNIVPILRIYIEDYLYGVVGYEMSNSWPLEALKAQAVAARNYALRCMSTRSQRAYHVVDTSTVQVFRGYNGSQARVIQAVDGTRGLALYAGPSLAACYYSASNGGQTEATRNVWGGDLAYSVVKDDPYDLANPSATAKAATIRRDATGLDERLMQALRAGTGGAGDRLHPRYRAAFAQVRRPQPPVYEIALHRGDGGRAAAQRGCGYLWRAGDVVRPGHQSLGQ